jgi:prevent-host-death family protein
MAVEKTVNAVQARQQLGRLLEEVFYQSQRVIIERAGRPMAVLVPLEQYRQWQEQRTAFFAMVDEVRGRTRDIPPEELEAVIAEASAAAKAQDVSPATD